MLRFAPPAWAKLMFLRDYRKNEVGGFGISSRRDLLLIEDVRLMRQRCSATSVELDDTAVADFFDAQVDRGLRPEQFGRVWFHTHLGRSARPSRRDEATFARCFAEPDWAVMVVLATGDVTYARLKFNNGPGASFEIPVGVDFRNSFGASAHAAWRREYRECVLSVDPKGGAS